MSNPFKIGDAVELINNRQNQQYSFISIGTEYTVIGITSYSIDIIDDDGDTMGYGYAKFMLVSHAPVVNAPTSGSTSVMLNDDIEEDDYATRKAKARVTSIGDWNKGTKLVYSDGTALPQGRAFLTVARCTATAIWFEETYSWPFFPADFIRA